MTIIIESWTPIVKRTGVMLILARLHRLIERAALCIWAVREVGPFLGSPAANHIRPTTFSAHLRKFRMSGLSGSRRQQRAISMLSAASEKGLKTTPRGDPSSAQAGRIARPSPASTRLIAECGFNPADDRHADLVPAEQGRHSGRGRFFARSRQGNKRTPLQLAHRHGG